jgi:hypothetical protein
MMWANSAAGGPPFGTIIDATTFVPTVAPTQLGLTSTTVVSGIRDLGESLMYEPASPNRIEVDQLSYAFATLASTMVANAVGGRDPFVRANTLATYVSLYGDDAMFFAVMQSDGSIGSYTSYTGSAAVAEFAGDDGPDHVHVAMRFADQTCVGADVVFSTPSVLQLGQSFTLPGVCTAVSIAASADATDNFLAFWQIATDELDAKYVDISGSSPPTITVTASGRAPRVRYDGSKYRLAWIDTTTGSDQLELGEYPPAGALTSTPLPGWQPAGDAAFQLVRQNDAVWLVILSATELTVLRLC